MSLLIPTKPVTLTIKGRTLVLSPLNLNVLIDIQDELGGLQKASELMKADPPKALRHLLFIFIKRQQPEYTLEDIGDLVDYQDMDLVCEVINKVMDMEA